MRCEYLKYVENNKEGNTPLTYVAFFVIFRHRVSGKSIGNLAEAVGVGFACGGREDDKPYLANQRDERDENPATPFAYVVHTSYTYSQSREDGDEAEQSAEDVDKAGKLAVGACEQPAEEGQNYIYEKFKQHEIPEFRA